MVVHREKRCSNASSRGIYPTVPPSSSRGSPNPWRRWNEAHGLRKETNGNLAGASQDAPDGSSRDPSTDVERRLRPRPRVSTALKKPKDIPSRRQQWTRGTCFIAVKRSKDLATNPSPPWPAGGSPTERLDRERRRSRGGTERSSLTSGLEPERNDESGGERTRISSRWDAGAQRARRIHHWSNPVVEGP